MKVGAGPGIIGWIIHAVREVCRPHADLYLAVVLSLTTGAWQGEVMSLLLARIDFKRQVITLHETKNGESRSLPLAGEALSLLQERAKARKLKDDRIFPPTAKARKADCLDLRQPWEAALKATGIADFHWHDLRHTAASYLAMSGVSLVEIAKLPFASKNTDEARSKAKVGAGDTAIPKREASALPRASRARSRSRLPERLRSACG